MRLSICLASCAIVLSAVAQPATQLALQTYPGLNITGDVGTVYAIEDTTDLTQTNNWRCLTFLQLPATNYLWVDTSTPTTSRRFYRSVAFAAPTNLAFIPPGTFRMGSPSNEVDRLDNEGPQMSVTISRGFWMGRYLVTQGEYLALMGNNPSHFVGDTNRPIDNVYWRDASNYCARLTARQVSTGAIPTNCVYRLPTEAEWEYACRAWTSDRRFYYGDDPGYTSLTNYAWYNANSDHTTHPVGQLLPNPWGLYDMTGNVWQYCQDSYAPYPGGSVADPQGPPTSNEYNHVARGGSLYSDSWQCRSAARRLSATPAGPFEFGFRVVLAVAQP
jgi:formylglycine-generating enzyme required for sulfatase activity